MIKPEKLYRGDKIAIVSLSWGGVCKIRVFLMTAALAANVCGVGKNHSEVHQGMKPRRNFNLFFGALA